jgi:putative ABC transport system permease protein
VIGVIFAVGLMVVAFFTQDAVDYMMDKHFKQDQQYDYMLRFTAPVKDTELLNISRLEGVLKVEAFFEVPARIHFKGRSRKMCCLVCLVNLSLKGWREPIIVHCTFQRREFFSISRQPTNLALKSEIQSLLKPFSGLVPPVLPVRVVGINEQLIGGGSFVSLDEANRVILESHLISGAMLKVDPGKSSLVEQRINDINGVASIMSRSKEFRTSMRLWGSNDISIAIMVMCSVVLGFAIIYNSSTIKFCGAAVRNRTAPGAGIYYR